MRLVGGSGDEGADIIAYKNGRRFLYQAKRWKNKAGAKIVDETIRAMRFYHADVPVIVSLTGFDGEALKAKEILRAQGIPISFADASDLERRAKLLPENPPPPRPPRPYQEPIIQNIVQTWSLHKTRGLVVMATGLGKTFVAGESVRRISLVKGIRVLVLAHANALVYQLEEAFWPFLNNSARTVVWNSSEKPTTEQMEAAFGVFACNASVSEYLARGNKLPDFDVVIIDECHHAGASMYQSIIEAIPQQSFLLGLTATPWRSDDKDISQIFGSPIATMDMVAGMRKGFLANVDYRIYTDNIDWTRLSELKGPTFSPKHINRTLFIKEWNDSVIDELAKAWTEQSSPRCIVFCGTIDHAITMRDKINARGFCRAEAMFSQVADRPIQPLAERQKILCDFEDGRIQVVCAVDIFNEGIDVPDVNIMVFQRVTHSRRIFIQQLGRGLRVSDSKDKVIVLDFVSDIRRFAATIELKDGLSIPRGAPVHASINHKVEFRRVNGEDPRTESFLREWLEDIATIAEAGDDDSILKFPPASLTQDRS